MWGYSKPLQRLRRLRHFLVFVAKFLAVFFEDAR